MFCSKSLYKRWERKGAKFCVYNFHKTQIYFVRAQGGWVSARVATDIAEATQRTQSKYGARRAQAGRKCHSSKS